MIEAVGGRCHCEAVKVEVPALPADVTECGCSICRRHGALWAYYPSDAVAVAGPATTYIWGRRRIAYHLCGTCGCVMAWLPLGGAGHCGINARMLDGFRSDAVPHIVEEDASV